MDYVDSRGRTWEGNENELDRFCKKHKLTLTIEYLSGSKDSDNYAFTETKVLDRLGNKIIDKRDFYPLSDSEILYLLKNFFRDKKISDLGI
jgi:hypothetical protein